MAREHAGKPSGNSEEQANTGIPTKTGNEAQDQDLTERYTEDDTELADGVRVMNPNRNVDKGDATGAGGYKN